MKKLLATLLILVTLFTATTGLASSLEDKLTAGLWINKDTNEACEFFRRDGNLTCSINKFTEGYFTMLQDFESQVVVLNDDTILLALNLFTVSFDELDWGGGTGVVMTLHNDADGMTLSFYTHRTAAFDEVI